MVLGLVFIFPITNNIDSAEAEAIESNTAINIITGRSSANVDITPINSNGTFSATDNTSNIAFTVTTDNLTGYSLILSGDDASGALANDDYNDTLASINSITDASTFETGSSATYTNKWGIKPSMLNSSSNTDYLPAPTTTSSIPINETNAKNTTADSYTIDLGARVDYTKPAGTYTNTFILQATSKPVLYEIRYSDTTSDATVANLPSNDTSDATNISGYKLPTTVPTRTGYTFTSWCEGTVTHVASGDSTCSGSTYAAGTDYTIGTPSSITKTIVELEAMWSANTHNVTKKYRLQNTDGSWGSYTTESTTTARYGSTISYSKQITNYKANGGANNSTVSASSTMPDDDAELALDFYRNTFTCKISYKYQNANDNNYGSATVAVNTTKRYQEACSWSTSSISGFDSATFNANSYTNNSISSNIDTTISITRKTYTLTINRNTSYISSTSGAGTYKAGQTVSISASTSYSNFTKWTLNNASGTQISTAASTTYTMPKANTTIYANGDRPNMADFTKSTCSTRASSGNIWLYDARDNQYYTARYINGNCWMTRNIAIGCNGSGATYSASRKGSLSLTTSNSNVSGAWTLSTSTVGNLASVAGTTTEPRMQCTNAAAGAWYNYKAATAGYITGDSDSREGSYSICPIGWRLPSATQTTTIAGTTYLSQFSAATGGGYYNGTPGDTWGGFYWSSTAVSSDYSRRQTLDYIGSRLNADSGWRGTGIFVRCVRN